MNEASDAKRKNLLQNLIKNFSLDKPFEGVKVFLGSFYLKRSKKHSKLLKKAQTKLLKQLDLLKFIKSMRLQMSATVGLLTP